MGAKCCISSDYLKEDQKFSISSVKSPQPPISRINSVMHSEVSSVSKFNVKNSPNFRCVSDCSPDKKSFTATKSIDAAEVGKSYVKDYNINRFLQFEPRNINGKDYKNLASRLTAPRLNMNKKFDLIENNNNINEYYNEINGSKLENYFERENQYFTFGNNFNFDNFRKYDDLNVLGKRNLQNNIDFDKYLISNTMGSSSYVV